MKGKILLSEGRGCLEVELPQELGGFTAYIEEITQTTRNLSRNIVGLGIDAVGKVPEFGVGGESFEHHVRDKEIAKLTKKFMRMLIAGEGEQGQIIEL